MSEHEALLCEDGALSSGNGALLGEDAAFCVQIQFSLDTALLSETGLF